MLEKKKEEDKELHQYHLEKKTKKQNIIKDNLNRIRNQQMEQALMMEKRLNDKLAKASSMKQIIDMERIQLSSQQLQKKQKDEYLKSRRSKNVDEEESEDTVYENPYG